MIPDEVKLKNDMEKLREEYPKRIAELDSMIRELEGSASGSVNSLDISGDGTYFVSAGDDKLVKVGITLLLMVPYSPE